MIQSFEIIPVYGHARFDLNWEKIGSADQEQVHFVSLAVAVEMQITSFSTVQAVLQGFSHNHILKKISS